MLLVKRPDYMISANLYSKDIISFWKHMVVDEISEHIELFISLTGGPACRW